MDIKDAAGGILNHQPSREVFILPNMYLIQYYPVDLCFLIYGRKYSMKIKLFMENMWEFFLVFYFVPYKVDIPMHVGEFFYVFILFYTKLIFPQGIYLLDTSENSRFRPNLSEDLQQCV
jgi:hypothetical protein